MLSVFLLVQNMLIVYISHYCLFRCLLLPVQLRKFKMQTHMVLTNLSLGVWRSFSVTSYNFQLMSDTLTFYDARYSSRNTYLIINQCEPTDSAVIAEWKGRPIVW